MHTSGKVQYITNVSYIDGYHTTIRPFSVHQEVFSPLGDIMRTSDNVQYIKGLQYIEGYYAYIGQCSVHQGCSVHQAISCIHQAKFSTSQMSRTLTDRYHTTIRPSSVHQEVLSPLADIMHISGDVQYIRGPQYIEGYHAYIGQCSVHQGCSVH